MIKNDKQHAITQRKLSEFEDALLSLKAQENISDLIELQISALEGQIETFRDEIEEYKELKSGSKTCLHINTIYELPSMLIKARIILGWSQAELASKLGIQEQQIQRYEATDYESVSLDRLYDIVDALKIKITPTNVIVKKTVFKIPSSYEATIIKQEQQKIKCRKRILQHN